MEWINKNDELPPEEKEENTLWFDVWANGNREPDAKFKDGDFYRQVLDYQDDYSHDEKIEDVTHWMYVTEPEQ